MKWKYSFLITLVLAFLLVIVACSGDGGADTSSADEESEEGSEENADGDTASDEEQVLVYARGGDSTSLDFASVSDGESSRVTKNIFESLLDYEKDSFEVVPGLAHDWEVSDDGLKYTFQLEEGVTFHDDTDFNAEAVKINFERWADPEHEYAFKDEGYAYPLYGTMFGGYKGDEGHIIEEINVVNDYEIEFVLKQPQGSFLQNMAMHYFAITSPTALEEYGPDIGENPVGTGPFQFVSWSKDDQIVLEKFEDYRKEDLPKLDQVIYEVIPENSARLIALRSGDVDLIDGVNPDDAAGIESEDGLELYVRGENNIGFLGMNVEKEPLDDKLVRQAINHAVDNQSIVDALYAGYATPAVNLTPPNYMGYNDEIEGYDYDTDRAKELLAEAGHGDGFEMDLWVMPVARPYMPDPETVAEIVQSNLSEVGITTNIVREEWAPYLEKTSQGEQELYLLGWSGSNGDPDYFFGSLLHGDSIGGENRSFYQNEEVDELIDQAATTIDQDKRAELYKEVQVLLHEDAPGVNLVHSTPLAAAKSEVKGFIPHPSTSDPLEEVYIEN
ncbi:peptide/nickel transport system substrate-binding protein [Lentibacillus halodurans]|uniref:Peptide/nickel transport system substrate-binding protein n=1 Tax=Lentibacillus halodurans TaxID=237679 RepID=A0A1I0YP99_9BACI|nr:ABC transporter substrate-binding protein [Lentibacillus halodurans]SFB14757.1 peptide/nickel transport system substrate-binding protein [Lentibacillus halodurans]